MTDQPARYRRTPADIEAVQWTGTNTGALRAFAGGCFDTIDPEDRIEDPDQDAQLLVEASHWVGIKPGDWVVKYEGYFVAKADATFRAVWEPAASPVPPPADQTALRDRIAGTLIDWAYRSADRKYTALRRDETVRANAYSRADAVLAVLPEPTDRAAEAERPLSPDYEHPACGFHWHGRDGMDIPIRDGQPVCPRCELAKAEKKLAYVQRMRDEVGAECKRRGRIKLEQAERIVRLERELDGVRDQLGKEMLRADDAEAELRRLAAEEQPAETQGGFELRGTAEIRGAVLLEAANALAALGPTDSLVSAPKAWNEAIGVLRNMAAAECAHGPERHGPEAGCIECRCNMTTGHAVGEQPETQETPNPRTVCTCGHTRGEHVTVSWRLLCDACDPDSTNNLVCKEFEAL